MFLKMLKNDLIATLRYFMIIACIILIAAVLSSAVLPVDSGSNGLEGLGSAIMIVLILVIMVTTVSICGLIYISSFLKAKFFSKEAYLTLTLPISTRKNVLSKLLAISIWALATIVFASFCFSMTMFFYAIRYSIENSVPLFNFFSGTIQDMLIDSLFANFKVFDFIYHLYSSIALSLSMLLLIFLLLTISQIKFFKNNKFLTSFITVVILFLTLSLISQNFYFSTIMITESISLNSLLMTIFCTVFPIGSFYLSCYLIDHKIEIT